MQVVDLCEEIGKTVTLQKVFNLELFPKNSSLRGLKRLTAAQRTQMLTDKLIRAWHDQQPNAHEVDMLLKAGVDVECPLPKHVDGGTLLGFAARRGYMHCVDALLRHGANPDARAPNGLTIFQQAAYCGQVEVMEYLAARGADLSRRTDSGMTPLMLVVNGVGDRAKCNRAIEFLLARGASLDDKENGGLTVMDIYNRNRWGYQSAGWKTDWAKPLLDAYNDRETRRKKEEATRNLMKAVRNTGGPGGCAPTPEALKRYIDAGADIECIDGSDHWKDTPLGILAHYNCVKQIEVLIAAGANVSPRHPERSSTPLTTAAFFGYTGLVRLLLDHGADINEADNEGKSALINTLTWGCRRETAQLLIERGAPLRATDKEGRTVFDHCRASIKDCAERGRDDTEWVQAERDLFFAEFRQLRDKPGALEATSGAWKTDVLCAAAAAGDMDIATRLVSAGADAAAKNADGRSPLHCAAAAGQAAMAGYLIAQGAAINAADADGDTPLMRAINPRCHTEVANLLLDHGAYADVVKAWSWGLRSVQDLRLGSVVENGKSFAAARAEQGELAARIYKAYVDQTAQQFTEGTRNGVALSRKLRLKAGPQGGAA